MSLEIDSADHRSGCLRVTCITLMTVLATPPVSTTENQTAGSRCKCQHPHQHMGTLAHRTKDPPRLVALSPLQCKSTKMTGVYGTDGSKSLTHKASHSQTSSMSHNPAGPSGKLTWVQESQEEAEPKGYSHADGM